MLIINTNAHCHSPSALRSKNNSTDPKVMRKRYESWLKRHGRKYRDKIPVLAFTKQMSSSQSSATLKTILTSSRPISLQILQMKSSEVPIWVFDRSCIYRQDSCIRTMGIYQKAQIGGRMGADTHVKDQSHCGKPSCKLQ